MGTLSLVFGIILILGGLAFLAQGLGLIVLFQIYDSTPTLLQTLYILIPSIVAVVVGALLISKYDADKNEPKKTELSGGYDAEL